MSGYHCTTSAVIKAAVDDALAKAKVEADREREAAVKEAVAFVKSEAQQLLAKRRAAMAQAVDATPGRAMTTAAPAVPSSTVAAPAAAVAPTPSTVPARAPVAPAVVAPTPSATPATAVAAAAPTVGVAPTVVAPNATTKATTATLQKASATPAVSAAVPTPAAIATLPKVPEESESESRRLSTGKSTGGSTRSGKHVPTPYRAATVDDGALDDDADDSLCTVLSERFLTAEDAAPAAKEPSSSEWGGSHDFAARMSEGHDPSRTHSAYSRPVGILKSTGGRGSAGSIRESIIMGGGVGARSASIFGNANRSTSVYDATAAGSAAAAARQKKSVTFMSPCQTAAAPGAVTTATGAVKRPSPDREVDENEDAGAAIGGEYAEDERDDRDDGDRYNRTRPNNTPRILNKKKPKVLGYGATPVCVCPSIMVVVRLGCCEIVTRCRSYRLIAAIASTIVTLLLSSSCVSSSLPERVLATTPRRPKQLGTLNTSKTVPDATAALSKTATAASAASKGGWRF